MSRDALGGGIDASVERDAAIAALSEPGSAVRLVASSAPSAAAEEGYGPEPVRPVVLELTIGSAEVSVDGAAVAATEVLVSLAPLAWGSWGGKPFERVASRVELTLADGRKLAISEHVAEDDAAARAATEPLATALREAIAAAPREGDASTPPAAAAAPPASRDAVRFGLRLEGELLVLRDFDSRGPKEGAGKFRVLALIALVLALLVWAQLAGAVRASAELATLLGTGAVALVLSLAAFAMNEIARFANKYTADSAPLAWFGDDHVVVAPWVSRKGAVDLRPEGRFGAAIKIAEVNAVVVREDKESLAITLETEHGPIDVLYTAEREVATRWRRAIERALVSVAAPQKRAIPLVRASASARA